MRLWTAIKTALGTLSCVVAGNSAAYAQPSGSFPQTIDFNTAPPGQSAAGFSTGLTGGQGSVTCLIQADSTSPDRGHVLTINSSNRTNPVFPLCLYEALRAGNVDLSVRFKPVAGKLDQAAGIVLRARDFNNYYVVRANALENNVRLYHVLAGRRTQFAGSDVSVPSGVWQSLRITVKASHFAVHLNDRLLFEADDETFADAGRVGLWVKSDSITLFDDFTIISASE